MSDKTNAFQKRANGWVETRKKKNHGDANSTGQIVLQQAAQTSPAANIPRPSKPPPMPTEASEKADAERNAALARWGRKEFRYGRKGAVAFHEAAHCVVSEEFGRKWWCRFERKRGQYGGLVGYSYHWELSSFQHVMITWAGPIAEYLAAWPLDEWPKVRATNFVAKQRWWLKFLQATQAETPNWRLHLLDEGYISGIRRKWAALEKAWHIVVKHRAEIARIAEILIARLGTANLVTVEMEETRNISNS